MHLFVNFTTAHLCKCFAINCIGVEYECIKGKCYCADGFVPNQFHDRCVPCPGLGEKCFGPCCNRYGNGTLQCWQGKCQQCYDSYGNFVCRDGIDQILLISTTQIVMGSALILGIIATFILLYKLCAATTIGPFGGEFEQNSQRLSIGSLQVYVEERLRDAPPRYSRTPTTDIAVYPAIAYLNSGFIHDSSIPPPPYTEEKLEENTHNTVHI
uniref:EGF-like domain-containing protein n=1 Tax=Bombyx mori TaxID=7091 RepID=A0A8R2HLX9_BOMMO|nr:uncharacterized protein LOC101741905 isoform X1 [Bombyx mori]